MSKNLENKKEIKNENINTVEETTEVKQLLPLGNAEIFPTGNVGEAYTRTIFTITNKINDIIDATAENHGFIQEIIPLLDKMVEQINRLSAIVNYLSGAKLEDEPQE